MGAWREVSELALRGKEAALCDKWRKVWSWVGGNQELGE